MLRLIIDVFVTAGRYCQVEADGLFCCPVWRVQDGLEPNILGVDRLASRQLDNATRTPRRSEVLKRIEIADATETLLRQHGAS